MRFFDEDIKIADELPLFKFDINADNEKTKQILEREKANGNLEKASRLGAALAGEVWSLEQISSVKEYDLTEDDGLLLQVRMLFCFAVHVAADEYAKNNIISKKVLSVFNSALKDIAPDFYSELEDSGSFSFYYLEYRSHERDAMGIGKAFAMLSSREGEKAYEDFGERLYREYIEIIKKHIEDTGFVD